jgi:hypothetical protein
MNGTTLTYEHEYAMERGKMILLIFGDMDCLNASHGPCLIEQGEE